MLESIERMYAKLDNLADLAAKEWYRQQCIDPHQHLYLWFKPAKDGNWGAILVSENAPNKEYQLADPRRISPAWTQEQAKAFIRQVIHHLPIVGEN